MGHGEELLVLGVLFVIAYLLGRLGKLIGLPAIPVYMAVGLLASPDTTAFPLNVEPAEIELVAAFGLIFLLFSLGLEFDQEEFFGNARSLLISGGSRIAINMAVGLALGFAIGWGGREALVIAGMTAVSSSAIITKLLIELGRLANRETPVILGIAVVEDVFIALYLAIVGVVISGETDLWPIVLQLAVSFLFLVGMFALARYGARVVSRLVQTKDDELFTILFFGLAVAFGGIGQLIGVSEAIGAFLIGLVLGASRFRGRIEQMALPLRDIFGAFFFLNFGLVLDVGTFGEVIVPVLAAVLLTLVVNNAGAQLIARLNGLTVAEGVNVGGMLTNRGEFALILATLATAAGLDFRLTPFAGLYVLSMAVIGPLLANYSERIGAALVGGRRRASSRPEDPTRDMEFALAEAAMRGQDPREYGDGEPELGGDHVLEDEIVDPPTASPGDGPAESVGRRTARESESRTERDALRLAEQAMDQSDADGPPPGRGRRERDPEY